MPHLACLLLLMTAPAMAAGAAWDELNERLRHRLEVIGEPGELVAGDRLVYSALPLRRFYEQRVWTPAWLADRARAEELLAQLLGAVEDAAIHGLEPEHYHLDEIRNALTWLRKTESNDLDSRILADIELLATDSFLMLGSHYASGRIDPATIDPGWFLERQPTEVIGALRRVVESGGPTPGAALAELLPRQPEYTVLVERLALQRSLAGNSAWDPLPGGAALRPGDRDPRIDPIRQRLEALGDLSRTRPEETEVYEQAMEEAVRRFQARHGLEIDGVIGTATLRALNVRPEERVDQLLANLERWRWLPAELGAEHIRVNIAGFSMDVFVDGDSVMRQRVIVGRPYRRTPVFTGRMTYLVLNPSWEVPPRMAAVDQLPRILNEPDYLERMGFSVRSGWGAEEREIDPAEVDWSGLSRAHFPFRLRQSPGPDNALGRIKFMFPNRHNVYLHDTPARELFAPAARAFSSGCIRVEDPFELAEWLLDGPERPRVMTAGRIREILDSGRETTVPLGRAVPVHLLYWTAWVERDGTVHYRDDIYGRDTGLIEALHRPPPGAATD